MRRKETLLEKKLIDMGYRLSHKTYTGKYCDKVESYVYHFTNGETEFFVCLNQNREQIVCYYFTNDKFNKYDVGKIESLQYVHEHFEESLINIYDFVERRVKE